MADATYQQGAIRREQGNNNLAVGSGGTVTVESGGGFTVASGGSVTVSSGGAVKVPVTAGTTAANFPAFGAVTFGSTAAKSYTLTAPAGGEVVYLRCTAGTTTALQTIQSGSTAITFDGTKTKLVFNAAGDAATLVAESATRWGIYSNVGSVVTST